MMRIIPASIEDIDDLATLVQTCYRGDSSRKGWTHEADIVTGIRTNSDHLRADLCNPSITILKGVNNEGKMIGCVHAEIEKGKMMISMLCIQPELQGAGLGKQLLTAVDKLAKEMGCTAAIMIVISKRKELIEFYHRRGFKNTGRREPFPMDAPFGKPLVPLEFIEMEKEY